MIDLPLHLATAQGYPVFGRKVMRIIINISLSNGRTIETQALIDSGASGIFIDKGFIKREGIETKSISNPISVFNADGTENKAGIIRDYLEAKTKINGRTRTQSFLVTSLGREKVILGYTWLEQENPDIDWKQKTLQWRTSDRKNIYTIFRYQDPDEIQDQNLVISYIQGEPTEEARETWVKTRMSHSQLFALEEEKAKAKPAEQIVPKALHSFLKTAFAEREIGELPPRRSYDHKIDLQPDFIPKRGVLYRQGPEHDAILKEFIDENLAKGFIRPSESPQAASFFFVPKKDGKTRPVQDYQYVNSGTVKNAYPLPRIDDLIDKLRGKKLFCKFDIRWGYNNVRIREGDEWKAAFICKFGLFEPTVMFFGLCNSPATFQSMIDDIFRIEIAQGWLLAYMDDILIANDGDEEDMLNLCRHVLQKLVDHNLFIKPEKCEFLKDKIGFLGFVIGDGIVSMEPQKVAGIADWPPPQNVPQLRSFIGFCNFYRRFVDHYADKCQPLNELLRKTTIWIWTPERHTAFENLKVAYVSQPVLLIPDFTKAFRIEADASLYTTGGVLLQDDINGDEHPVAYFSKSFSPAERNYQVFDREFCAILHALREWDAYIKGSPFQTVVYTDHANLTYYRSPQKLTRRQTRWVIELMEYDIKLCHKPGKKMIPADALSRRHDHAEGLKDDNEPTLALPEDLFIQVLDLELQDAVMKAQEDDETAQEALARLSDPSHSPTKWMIEEGFRDGLKCLFYDGRLYVPDDLTLRRKIVSDHHDSPLAGHPGIQATTRSVRLSYWWPGLTSFVRNYVDGCAVCQQFKISTRPTKPSLQPIPSGSSRIFGAVGVDFMTDLPSSDGFDSIMVTVDHGLTKGLVLTATTKEGLTTDKTAQLYIDNIYSRFGLPDSIISDRGPQFDSELFQTLCKALGIKSKLTTAFHPQANGGTERTNREIQLYLSIFCINNPESWKEKLKLAEFVYNNRTHAERNETPFELMYGATPKAIPDAFYRQPLDNEARLEQATKWRQDALIAHEYARQKMKEKIKSTYEPFKLGQKVWLNGRNIKLGYNKKITTKHEGPFKIIEILGPVNYRLKLPDKWRLHNNFHACLLTPYKENDVHGPNFPQPPPDIIDGEAEYEVERIISHRGHVNRHYQVKWRGYDDLSWEPAANLRNADESIQDYWKRKKTKSSRNRS